MDNVRQMSHKQVESLLAIGIIAFFIIITFIMIIVLFIMDVSNRDGYREIILVDDENICRDEYHPINSFSTYF